MFRGHGTRSILYLWWFISSCTNRSTLSLSTGGVFQTAISGEVGWKQKSFVLPSAQQTLRWVVSPVSGAQPVGNQWAWVDGFTVGSGLPPAITREPLGGTVATGVPCLLSAAVAGTGPLVCQWYVNGDPLLAANQPLLTIPLALPAH